MNEGDLQPYFDELMNDILRLVKYLLRFYSWMSMKHYTTIDLGMHTIYIIQCDKRKVSTAVNLKAVTSKMYKTVVYCDITTSHIFTDKKIHRLPENALDNVHLFVYCFFLFDLHLFTWTMVKYRAALWSFLKLTALVFYHVWHSPWGVLER